MPQYSDVPLHWHQLHDEYLEITEGAMNLYHHGEWFLVTPDDGVVCAERGTVHGFKSCAGVKVTIKERVHPNGDYKIAFLKDISQTSTPGFWLVVRVAYNNDLYPWLSRFKWLVRVPAQRLKNRTSWS